MGQGRKKHFKDPKFHSPSRNTGLWGTRRHSPLDGSFAKHVWDRPTSVHLPARLRRANACGAPAETSKAKANAKK